MDKVRYYKIKKIGHEFESRLMINTFSIFVTFFVLLVLSLVFSSVEYINTILIIDFFVCSILFIYKLSVNIKNSIVNYNEIDLKDDK